MRRFSHIGRPLCSPWPLKSAAVTTGASQFATRPASIPFVYSRPCILWPRPSFRPGNWEALRQNLIVRLSRSPGGPLNLLPAQSPVCSISCLLNLLIAKSLARSIRCPPCSFNGHNQNFRISRNRQQPHFLQLMAGPWRLPSQAPNGRTIACGTTIPGKLTIPALRHAPASKRKDCGKFMKGNSDRPRSLFLRQTDLSSKPLAISVKPRDLPFASSYHLSV